MFDLVDFKIYGNACLICLSHLCRYWWLKLKSLSKKDEWEELEKFSKTKKSPIGYLVRTSSAIFF